jgi:hypothetical protein
MASVSGMITPEFELDIRERTLAVQASNGQTVRVPLPAGTLEMDTNIERLIVSPDLGEVVVGLPDGVDAHVELRGTELALDELRARRPAIYLDQNHWSTIAAARFGHVHASADDRRASGRLVDLVEAKEILLPISAGHLVETTPLYGEPRTALATTVLQLGRGWQMRNPLHVRVEEILRAVQGRLPAAADVFAPQADGFFGSAPSDGGDDASDPLSYIGGVMPAILGLYDAVVDPQAIPDVGGVAEAAAEAWAGNWARLAARLHAAGEPPAMVRRVAYANLIVDLRDDVLGVARLADIAPQDVIDCLFGPGDPVSRMPFLGQMRQLLFARLRNRTQTWEANDLVDVVFLSCAAGYADIVVGERSAIGYLRQARAPRPSARLATSLSEAVALLAAVKAEAAG